MKRLLEKYKKDTLTLKELQSLRDQTQDMNDEELEQMFLNDWVASGQDRFEADLIDFDQMEKSIEHMLWVEDKPAQVFTLSKILRYAAILLLPVLLISTFYFYHKTGSLSVEDMIVKVGEGERVSITLPDGTNVKINSKSELRYNPAIFNRSTRLIHFDGEGYFDVTSNPDVPFVIESQNLKLKVLGTTFNFLSRERLDEIEVTLIKGHVLLSSANNNQELFENEKALFDKKTGTFEILKDNSEEPVIHWMRNELYFKNVSFPELLNSIEREYNIRFNLINCDQLSDDTFSGTLPSTDLGTVMDILKKSYGFNYNITSNIVTIEVGKD